MSDEYTIEKAELSIHKILVRHNGNNSTGLWPDLLPKYDSSRPEYKWVMQCNCCDKDYPDHIKFQIRLLLS